MSHSEAAALLLHFEAITAAFWGRYCCISWPNSCCHSCCTFGRYEAKQLLCFRRMVCCIRIQMTGVWKNWGRKAAAFLSSSLLHFGTNLWFPLDAIHCYNVEALLSSSLLNFGQLCGFMLMKIGDAPVLLKEWLLCNKSFEAKLRPNDCCVAGILRFSKCFTLDITDCCILAKCASSKAVLN